MRVLVARCEIAYEGRLLTRLAPGDRVILFKGDGSVAVHNTRGAKPVNYMAGPTVVEEDGDVIRVRRSQSGELLTILVHSVHADASHPLEDGAALEREGRELQLHARIARAPHVVEQGLLVVERERPTDVGPVDFFCRDAAGVPTLVEVKRVRAVAAAVEQVVRYREQVERDPALRPVRALVVAPDFAPQARALASARGVECVVLDVAALPAGAEPDLRLFDG
jgi:RecB family endonuclease NucS